MPLSTKPYQSVTAWQPESLHDDTFRAAAVTLPEFETIAPAAPSLKAFEMSRSIGIPDDMLASATAAARASGYADGWATGMAEARAATDARLAADQAAADAAARERDTIQEQALAALFEAADSFEQRAAPSAGDIEDQIITTAWSIASALLGQALADDDVRGPAAIKRALSLASADDDVTVSVSAEDFAVLTAGSDDERITRRRGARTVTILPDQELSPGDAVARSGAMTIDARISAAIDRVKQVLEP